MNSLCYIQEYVCVHWKAKWKALVRRCIVDFPSSSIISVFTINISTGNNITHDGLKGLIHKTFDPKCTPIVPSFTAQKLYTNTRPRNPTAIATLCTHSTHTLASACPAGMYTITCVCASADVYVCVVRTPPRFRKYSTAVNDIGGALMKSQRRSPGLDKTPEYTGWCGRACWRTKNACAKTLNITQVFRAYPHIPGEPLL